MFRHMLVPLDGSRQAEKVLPAVAGLALALDARTTLLHVIEQGAPSAIHGEPHIVSRDEAEAYLASCTSRAFDPSRTVARHVHAAAQADVARSIRDHAVELGADLIVLCTHGRRHLRHRLFGTVAQAVTKASPAPVLLIPPGGVEQTWWPVKRILVATDGRAEHARAVPMAVVCARTCRAGLRLLWVVPTLGTLTLEHALSGQRLPGTTTALLEIEQLDATTAARAALAGAGIGSLDASVTVTRGEPVREIRNAADAFQAGLVVLGTHGRTGLDAVAAGSVAPRLAGQATWPLLLVPLAPE